MSGLYYYSKAIHIGMVMVMCHSLLQINILRQITLDFCGSKCNNICNGKKKPHTESCEKVGVRLAPTL